MVNQVRGYDLCIRANGINMSYNDVGYGNVPVIFLHGYPFSKSMWHPQLEFLQSTNRAIAYDIRGFGQSIDNESALRIGLFSEDLLRFMDKLLIDKAIVCGLSMGGLVALSSLKKYPERFEALVLCDTQCIADTEDVKEKRYKIIDEIEVRGATDFSERFVRSVFSSYSLENKKDLVSELRSVVFSNSQHIMSQGLVALAERSETCSSLSEIVIPTLIICGREDEVTPLDQSEYMHKSIKGSRLQIIDQAGHVSNLEQPREFNAYLLEFLREMNRLMVRILVDYSSESDELYRKN